MLKRNRTWIIVTGILILLPIIVGLILWKQLPETMAVQFSASDGTASGYRGKDFVVFALPVLILMLHIMAAVFTANDPRRQTMGDGMFRMLLFFCPMISWFIAAFTYTEALGIDIELMTLAQIFIGILVIIIGIVLPKCPQNGSIGFRFASTLRDEETWKKTHKVAGIIWILAGIFFTANAFLQMLPSQFLILLVAVMIGVPYFVAAKDYKNRHSDDHFKEMKEQLKEKEINRRRAKKRKK